ncbi:MAG: H+-translocating transhydrogenase subunit beta, partial [Actinomycetota bacterium]|nr:H+-translocating transhydrogenase subunit beta [Actinomycetota bacterium]
MTPTWVQLVELFAAVCFILALKGLSSPKSARNGNLIGAFGALIAVLVTFFSGAPMKNLLLILIAIAVGTAIGWPAARKVKMTAMPQLVALFNGV